MKSLPKCVHDLGAFAVAVLFASSAALAQFAQQGPKLVANDPANFQGFCVALSADGNTAIVGGVATFIWTRSGGVWTQQAKLVANDGFGPLSVGYSVAISADGNTAMVGEPDYNGATGAAWVWTRSGNVWTQQGPTLVGSDGRQFLQGAAVALSADGNTAMVGGPIPPSGAGAVWFWTRSGGVWTQQGPKIVGSGTAGASNLGTSVALSADGNTAIAGGPNDGTAGAAWVWTRSGGVWTQQGSKLVGTGGVGQSGQGISVALSADGNTALVGGYFDNVFTGAAWAWTRSGGAWTQQGGKLVASASTNSAQGRAVALSADGNTAIVGGMGDNANAGAAWVWTRSGSTWTQNQKLVGSGAAGASKQGIGVALAADAKTAMSGGFDDDNSRGAVWPFVVSADLSIVKAAGPGSTVIGGQTFPYLLAVTNLGPSTALNATITDVLPAGLTFVGAFGSGWSCNQAAGTVTCSAASLPIGPAPIVSIFVTPPLTMPALTNTATISTATPDPVSTNNSSTAVVNVVTSADLFVVVTPGSSPAYGSTPVTYTIAVANNGPSAAANVTVTDVFPTGASNAGASGSGWSCGPGPAPNAVSCTRAFLPAGAAPSIVVTVNAPTVTSPTTLDNLATIASTTPDPNPANNSSTATIPLLPAGAIPALGGRALALLAAVLAAMGFVVAARRA